MNSTSNGVGPYGFEHPPDGVEEAELRSFLSEYEQTVQRRTDRWQQRVSSRQTDRNSTMKRFVRKGIPREIRAKMWMEFSGAQNRMDNSPGLYSKLLTDPRDQTLHETVQLDIRRTYPDNIHFKSDEQGSDKLQMLQNVLVAFGMKNRDYGYTQGLNFITGILLLILGDEEKAFWLLDTIATDYVPGYYAPDLKSVKIDVEVLGRLVKRKLPAVHAVMEHEHVTWPIVCTKWFICLYSDVLPVETVLRIWDCMFYEGPKILLRVGLTLIKLNREQLVKCRSFPDVVTLFKSFASCKTTLYCHQFIQDIFKLPGSLPRTQIEKIREECRKEIEAEEQM